MYILVEPRRIVCLWCNNIPQSAIIKSKIISEFCFCCHLKAKVEKGLQKYTQKVWTLGLFFSKKNSLPFLHKMLIAKVFQTFCGWFTVNFSFLYFVWLLWNNSVWCLTFLWMHALLINSNISEGLVYAPFNLGQCSNVTLLDLVAVVVSLLTSCNIQTPSNYYLLNFIISLTFWKPLEPKKKKTTALR